jgi:hypothetical protein
MNLIFEYLDKFPESEQVAKVFMQMSSEKLDAFNSGKA